MVRFAVGFESLPGRRCSRCRHTFLLDGRRDPHRLCPDCRPEPADDEGMVDAAEFMGMPPGRRLSDEW